LNEGEFLKKWLFGKGGGGYSRALNAGVSYLERERQVRIPAAYCGELKAPTSLELPYFQEGVSGLAKSKMVSRPIAHLERRGKCDTAKNTASFSRERSMADAIIKGTGQWGDNEWLRPCRSKPESKKRLLRHNPTRKNRLG